MNEDEPQSEPRVQEFTLDGDEVVAKVKELIHEGNIRRLTIKNEDGRTMLEVPLTLGLIGAALLPVLAAIGAAAALATRCTIVVERDPKEGDSPPPSELS
jgi:Flp pilus assembly pilin Flp